jgi:hypothetical protein
MDARDEVWPSTLYLQYAKVTVSDKELYLVICKFYFNIYNKMENKNLNRSIKKAGQNPAKFNREVLRLKDEGLIPTNPLGPIGPPLWHCARRGLSSGTGRYS